MKVLVTGGVGFIGSHVVEELLKQGHEVCIVFNKTKPGKVSHLSDKVNFVHGDLRNIDDCKRAVKDINIIIDLAALINIDHSIQTPLPFYEINVRGTMNLLEAVRHEKSVKKFVYMSTFEIYGEILNGKAIEDQTFVDPRSPYGASKFTAERYCLSWNAVYDNPEITVIRGGNTFGPRQSFGVRGAVIATFITKLLEGKSPIIFGDGRQTRDYIYVKDMAKGIVKVATTFGIPGEIINLCSGEEISIKEIAEKIIKHTTSPLDIIYKESQPGENRRSVGDNTKASKLLNWAPTYSFDEGLKETVEYFKELVND